MGRKSIFTDVEGAHKKVLCVCSMGLLRSPTLAWILSNPPYNYNTRSAGTDPLALIPLTTGLIDWAEEVYCMNSRQELSVRGLAEKKIRIYNLCVPDLYCYRAEGLVALLQDRLGAVCEGDNDN